MSRLVGKQAGLCVPSMVMDGQSVKTTERGGVRGFDGHKLVKGRKRHILVDTLGLLIACRVEPANISDRKAASLLLRWLRSIVSRLAAGKHPFIADSSAQTAYSIATKRAPPLPHTADSVVSSRLEQLILAMLAKNPADRPPAAAVAKELSTISASPGILTSSTQIRENSFWLATLVACAVAVAAIAWLAHEKRDTPEFVDLKIQPLTSQPGWEDAPALSPDGQSIAFTWADRLDGVRNIYVKRLSEENSVKLTSNSEGSIGRPAWSPDGKQIAFKRSGKVYERARGGLYSIPAGGGKEQKLLDLVNPDPSSSIDWSPDGTELAFSDVMPGKQRLALYLFNLKTGKKRRLTSPPESAWGDWSPTFSPDGFTLAFKRVTSFWVDDLYLVPETGGALRQVTEAKRGIWGHTWMPDGKSLVVSCQRTGSIFGIWRFPLESNIQPERVSLAGIDAITPTTSRKTTRLPGWTSCGI